MVNIVGDSSSGKTLLAMEAAMQYGLRYPDRPIYYNETESAFDDAYAEALGMRMDRIVFPGEEYPDARMHVEGLFEDLDRRLSEIEDGGLYIVDSLDALSDTAELGRKIGDASMGGARKASKLSELFRRLVRRMEDRNLTLIVISQIRDNIGVAFGEKHKRSGGRAMDFYATQIIWLGERGKIKRVVDKVERQVGIKVQAHVKKNKVGRPFQKVEFPILFYYGIDDVSAAIQWLHGIGYDLSEFEIPEKRMDSYVRQLLYRGDRERVDDLRARITPILVEQWRSVEAKFQVRGKYHG